MHCHRRCVVQSVAAVMAESKIETESEWEVVSGILDDYTGIYTRNTMLG